MTVRFRSKSAAEQVAEQRLGRPIEDVIRERLEAGVTRDDLARELGVSTPTLYRWLDRMGLRVRTVVDKVA